VDLLTNTRLGWDKQSTLFCPFVVEEEEKKFCDIVYRGLMKTNRGVKMNYEKLSRAMRYHYGSIKQGRKGHLVSLTSIFFLCSFL
jgi:hypothetical protein